jgi:anti-anti-sigma factor
LTRLGAAPTIGAYSGKPKEKVLMEQPSPHFNVSTEGDVTIAEMVVQKILDEMSITEMGHHLGALATQTPAPKLVLDFGNVSHMSSAALGMLITLHKRVREKNGQLRLCNIQPSIYEVFVITRLNEILQICQSREEALASLG